MPPCRRPKSLRNCLSRAAWTGPGSQFQHGCHNAPCSPRMADPQACQELPDVRNWLKSVAARTVLWPVAVAHAVFMGYKIDAFTADPALNSGCLMPTYAGGISALQHFSDGFTVACASVGSHGCRATRAQTGGGDAASGAERWIRNPINWEALTCFCGPCVVCEFRLCADSALVH